MSTKTIVCRCEDVTLTDVAHAVELGYRDIEEVKRYTGLGTGPCGGKECAGLCTQVIAQATGQPPSALHAFTARPPVSTVAFGTLAGAPEEEP